VRAKRATRPNQLGDCARAEAGQKGWAEALGLNGPPSHRQEVARLIAEPPPRHTGYQP